MAGFTFRDMALIDPFDPDFQTAFTVRWNARDDLSIRAGVVDLADTLTVRTLELVRIPSPSGDEASIADHVERQLAERYASPLPQLTDEVEQLAAKVAALCGN